MGDVFAMAAMHGMACLLVFELRAAVLCRQRSVMSLL